MATEIVIVVFIVLLLGYIIYLHVQLAKKNLYIESTISRLSEIEKNLSPEQMRQFLNEIRKTHRYSSFFTEKLFEEKPLHFLLGSAGDSRVFIHYTKEQSDAMNIIREGFRFADSFYKTALPVSRDRLDLLVKHNSRKSFGDYLIILCISDILFDYYAGQLEKNDLKAFAVENVLTEIPPYRNENSDMIYLLPNKFVKGYINHQTGEIEINPEYNPAFTSPLFEKNLQMLNNLKNKI
jgi:hypothetical protein